MSNQFFTSNHSLLPVPTPSDLAGYAHTNNVGQRSTSSAAVDYTDNTGTTADSTSFSALPEFDLDESPSEVGSAAGDSAQQRQQQHGSHRPRKRFKTSDRGSTTPGALTDMENSSTPKSSSAQPRKSSTGSAKASGGSKSAKGKAKALDAASDAGTASDSRKGTPKPRQKKSGEKKKKAGRACCPETCHDGARKKAKYLMEVPDELLDRGRMPPPSEVYQPQEPSPLMSDQANDSPGTAAQEPAQQTFSFDTMPFSYDATFGNEFGSEAANLEYAILSTMLNGNGFSLDNFGQQAQGASDPRLTGTANASTMLVNSPLGNPINLTNTSLAPPVNGYPAASTSSFRAGPSTQTSPMDTNVYGMSPRLQDTVQNLFAPPTSKPTGQAANATSDMFGSNLDQFVSSGTGGTAASAKPRAVNGSLTVEEAYSITKPYNYAQSYHYLIKHLKSRFEKNDILRIIRALATIRPSLIALQMPLSEEDEVFVERTFQRTLVELNKLISFSGTPTVVWRRTGEICLVGTEFCLLTGWKREDLLGKKYIFELLDTASVVDLYEAFAKHAFESTSSSVTMQCVVLGPTGRPVPCAFCFSIRRDLFSCPSLVVGSFLPILT
ncbi:Transcriptional regulator of nonfermentable carbon utilization [Microbotryomycetes sp. JL201]|nr:Transcriptional regulator of nonfermentable carbon utilization [Microbotryomycetes sp. JL201]